MLARPSVPAPAVAPIAEHPVRRRVPVVLTTRRSTNDDTEDYGDGI